MTPKPSEFASNASVLAGRMWVKSQQSDRLDAKSRHSSVWGSIALAALRRGEAKRKAKQMKWVGKNE